jgi:hemerythrin-like domain-containing protein
MIPGMRRDASLHGLSHQHQHGLALCVVIRRTLGRDASEAARRDLAAKIERMWEAELEGHFAVEERVLFPALRGRIDQPLLIDQLVEQHRELENRIQDLKASPEEHRLLSFAQLLNDHIRIEERQLFEQAQEHLNDDELAELGRRLDAQIAKVCPAIEGLPFA